MKSIESNEFTPKVATRDIEYCLANANTRKLMDFKGEYFRQNPHIYINGSDNVVLPVSRVVKDGDSVLTVGASGDYMLDSVLYGAKEVVNYDINAMQYYVCCLKVWALQVLDYQEFIDFFTNFRSQIYLDYKVLDRIIAPFENEAAYSYWKRFSKQRRIESVAVRKIINDCYSKCLELIGNNLDKLENVALALLDREKISGEEFEIVFNGDKLPEIVETTSDEIVVENTEDISETEIILYVKGRWYRYYSRKFG